MASLTTECVSNTLVGEEMQHQLSHYFSSLTTDKNHDCQNPRAPVTSKGNLKDFFDFPGVRVHFFFAVFYFSIPFRLQSMATLKESDFKQMWEFIHI